MRLLRINWATLFSLGELACFFAAWMITVWATMAAPRPVGETTAASTDRALLELSHAQPLRR